MPRTKSEIHNDEIFSSYVIVYDGMAEIDWSIEVPPTPSSFQVDIMKPEELKFIDTTTMLMTVTYDSHEMIQEMRVGQEKMVTMLRRISDKLNVDSDDVLDPEATSDDGNSGAGELVQDVDDEIAREMIIQHLRGKGVTYPSDIADELNLDYDQVGRVLRQLEEEGVIEPYES